VLTALGRRGHEGTTAKEIVHDVFDGRVTTSTVETFAKRAYRKLGVNTRWDAVRKHRRLHAELCRTA
jgi:DNA-binding NarL/FixJ family response regulator